LVEGVATLHRSKQVHRDIKPDNIFVASDGRLVLGDFGLVFFEDDGHTRVSDTFENVGSRDWMPLWAQSMRIDEVEPNFDVFCLGKTLWYMVNGGGKLLAWYFEDPKFDLGRRFPNRPEMRHMNILLGK